MTASRRSRIASEGAAACDASERWRRARAGVKPSVRAPRIGARSTVAGVRECACIRCVRARTRARVAGFGPSLDVDFRFDSAARRAGPRDGAGLALPRRGHGGPSRRAGCTASDRRLVGPLGAAVGTSPPARPGQGWPGRGPLSRLVPSCVRAWAGAGAAPRNVRVCGASSGARVIGRGGVDSAAAVGRTLLDVAGRWARHRPRCSDAAGRACA